MPETRSVPLVVPSLRLPRWSPPPPPVFGVGVVSRSTSGCAASPPVPRPVVTVRTPAPEPDAPAAAAPTAPSLVGVLLIALAWKVLVVAAETTGAVVSGSFALRADLAHMGIDLSAVGVALWAARRRERGWADGADRAERTAVRVNAAILLLVGVTLVPESVVQLAHPPATAAPGWELAMAVVRIAASVAMARTVAAAGRRHLHLRAVELHAGADALSAGALLLSAAVLVATGWTAVDGLVGLVVAALVLRNGWHLLAHAART